MSPEAVWVGWLVLFLVYEITAAVAERGTTRRLTLSRNVWAWFDTVVEKVVLAVFLLVLTAHLVAGHPGGLAVILTGLPVAAIIAMALVRRRAVEKTPRGEGPGAAAGVALVVCLPLLLGADRCSVSWPQPSPSPSASPSSPPAPTPEPAPTSSPEPSPTPGPTPTATPAPSPSPDPAACPPVVLAAIQGGQRQYKAGPHGPQCFDATPRVCGDPAVSEAVGRPGQHCVPLGPECPEDSPEPCWRTACEEAFNAGPTPLWVGEGALRIGARPWEPDDGLVWQPCPRGVGRIKACDRGQRTCSPWVEVNRP